MSKVDIEAAKIRGLVNIGVAVFEGDSVDIGAAVFGGTSVDIGAVGRGSVDIGVAIVGGSSLVTIDPSSPRTI